MKVAVLADIHANLEALETVIPHLESWNPEVVIMGGDVVNRGPYPLECLQIVQEKQAQKGWRVVRGNHEDYVLRHARPDRPRSGPLYEIFQNSIWTYQIIREHMDYLRSMPFQVSLEGPDGRELRVVHASMRGNRDGIFPKNDDALLREQIEPAPAVLCAGHTHRPLVRTVDDSLVVNVGSVGMPFDGDQRAAYARLEWQGGDWQAEIVRLDYNWQATDRAFNSSGFLAEGGPLARIMHLELHQARSHIHLWGRQYERAVMEGEISLAESVERYLNRWE